MLHPLRCFIAVFHGCSRPSRRKLASPDVNATQPIHRTTPHRLTSVLPHALSCPLPHALHSYPMYCHVYCPIARRAAFCTASCTACSILIEGWLDVSMRQFFGKNYRSVRVCSQYTIFPRGTVFFDGYTCYKVCGRVCLSIALRAQQVWHVRCTSACIHPTASY